MGFLHPGFLPGWCYPTVFRREGDTGPRQKTAARKRANKKRVKQRQQLEIRFSGAEPDSSLYAQVR
jgi:hypothetical protein